MEKIKEWLKAHKSSGDGYGSGYGSGYGDGDGYGYSYGYGDGYGYGSGSGDGSGYGSGYGDGYGYGSGYGDGDGYGYGSGSGYGDGYGYGSGSGDGDGSGYGYGDGDGYGYGSGDTPIAIAEDHVFFIDGVPTIIKHIKESFAKGFILNEDLTMTPCYVAKGNGYFAHGNTLKKARESLIAKYFENMDTDEAIDKFLEKFKKGKKYPGTEFFEWHHYLTGSCLMGRESFVKNHGLNVDDKYTVDEFIELCENDYGGDIIRQLKEKYLTI